MMYDKESINAFEGEFQLNAEQAKAAINDWYSGRGD